MAFQNIKYLLFIWSITNADWCNVFLKNSVREITLRIAYSYLKLSRCTLLTIYFMLFLKTYTPTLLHFIITSLKHNTTLTYKTTENRKKKKKILQKSNYFYLYFGVFLCSFSYLVSKKSWKIWIHCFYQVAQKQAQCKLKSTTKTQMS